MAQNSVNPKYVEEYMIGLGFKWSDRSWLWVKLVDPSDPTSMEILFDTKSAAFLYQQTLLARRDTLGEVLAKNDWHQDDWGVECIYRKPIENDLAELNQLLQGSHNREEEK